LAPDRTIYHRSETIALMCFIAALGGMVRPAATPAKHPLALALLRLRLSAQQQVDFFLAP
jgi:hypothetical protein